MLKTKCIKAEKEESDGLRVSVMNRHTLDDGFTPDPDIDYGSYDEWWTDFAPPAQLVGDYLKRGLPWDKYEERYLTHIRKKRPKLQWLINRSLRDDVTLLCVEETPDFCHRRLLTEECKRMEPKLEILLR